MAKAKATVWVKNNDSTPLGAEVVVEGEKKLVVFAREKIDQNTGLTVSNGYTEIDKDLLDQILKENKIIKAFVDKKTIEIFDDEPEDALSPSQRVTTLRKQVAELTGELGESKDTVIELTNKVVSLEKEIEGLTAEIVALKGTGEPVTGEFREPAAVAGDDTGSAPA